MHVPKDFLSLKPWVLLYFIHSDPILGVGNHLPKYVTKFIGDPDSLLKWNPRVAFRYSSGDLLDRFPIEGEFSTDQREEDDSHRPNVSGRSDDVFIVFYNFWGDVF